MARIEIETIATATRRAAASALASAQRNVANGYAALDASSGLLVPKHLVRAAQTAPAAPASGWLDYIDTADGQHKTRSSGGVIKRQAFDWGEGTTLPVAGMQRGDVYRHTGVSCLLVYTGNNWRQATTAVVADAAARAAVASNTGVLHLGFRLQQTDTKVGYVWDGAAFQVESGDTGWLALPSFQTGFSAGAEGAQYRVRAGICQISAHIQKDSNGRTGNIAQLPTTARPSRLIWALGIANGAAFGEIHARTDGFIALTSHTSATGGSAFVIDMTFPVG